MLTYMRIYAQRHLLLFTLNIANAGEFANAAKHANAGEYANADVQANPGVHASTSLFTAVPTCHHMSTRTHREVPIFVGKPSSPNT